MAAEIAEAFQAVVVPGINRTAAARSELGEVGQLAFPAGQIFGELCAFGHRSGLAERAAGHEQRPDVEACFTQRAPRMIAGATVRNAASTW